MAIKEIINKSIIRKFNLLFVAVSEIHEGQLVIDKFYVNKEEYDNFATFLRNLETPKAYSYKYYSQKVDLLDFIVLFHLQLEGNNYDDLINNLNIQLKNTAIIIISSDEIVINHEYEQRIIVNEYFEERDIIKEKRVETFPLPLQDELTNTQEAVIFRVYNVGQANMSALLVGQKQEPVMIFDLGKSRRCKLATDLLSKQLKKQKRTTTIVISHYDNDHINMANYLPNSGTNLQFFMPEFLHPSDIYKPNIQLLVLKAVFNGSKVCFFLNDRLQTPITLGYATFLQGVSHKRDANQSTDENSHGLMVYLEIKNKTVFIPGDVLYDDLFTALPQPLSPNYVVVPHHACLYINKINNAVINMNNLEESFTFCGPHGGYHHPNLTHFCQYQVNNAKLVRLAKKNDKNIVYYHNRKTSDTFYSVVKADHYDWVL